MKKPTWNDLNRATPRELMKTYKMTPRQLEQCVSRTVSGATTQQRREFYNTVYNKPK